MLSRRDVAAAMAGLILPSRLCVGQRNADIDAASIFVFAGQSNAQVTFRTRAEVPSSIVADDKIKIWDLKTKRFVTYLAGINSAQPLDSTDLEVWGPEAEFSRLLRMKRPEETIYIIKFAVGATQLFRSPDGVATSDWNPLSAPSELFGRTEDAIRLAMLSLVANHLRPKVKMILWMQGESDSVDSLKANAYKQNLALLLSAMHSRWGDHEANIIVGRINKFWGVNSPVRRAQEQVSEIDPLARWIDTDAYPLDRVHYNGVGTVEFGKDVFTEFSKIEFGG